MEDSLRFTLALSLLFTLSCGPSWAAREGASLAEGTWGGPHIELAVGRDGVTVDMDCAHGAVAEPVVLGTDGRFRASGTYVPERGGPEREGGESAGRPAVYSGRLDGETLTLVITLEGAEEIGTFTLQHGRSGRIRKCL